MAELVFGGAINPGDCRAMFLAIDRSGGSTNNNIYMLASVVPSGRSTTDVMFVRSTDDGLTFSAPQKINDDPVNPSKWHWFGTFSVAPNGRLDAVWYDTRNAANNTDSQLFYSYSTDAGVTWSANVAVSNSFNPFEGYPNQNKIGDYITIVSDETGGNVAYSATFNFNPNNGQHEEDVYYVRVFPGGQGATPTPTATVSLHLRRLQLRRQPQQPRRRQHRLQLRDRHRRRGPHLRQGPSDPAAETLATCFDASDLTLNHAIHLLHMKSFKAPTATSLVLLVLLVAFAALQLSSRRYAKCLLPSTTRDMITRLHRRGR